MENQILWWVGFNLFVLLMLALDLGVFHRKTHVVSVGEALTWTAVWVVLALAFNVLIYYVMGATPALAFLTGYLVEKSLSMDNVFVFYLIFSYFGVPAAYQHRVLFWGILGALVMRAILIAFGIALINQFHWIIYVFGGFLIYTGIRMVMSRHAEVHPESNPALKMLRRLMPITPDYHKDSFFVRIGNVRHATPLFAVLLLVETTDLIFALDSIPAIIAITTDPFIVYTSNVFAILGLRALYFALAGVVKMFDYLHYGLAAILVFVGVKMTISHFYKIPIGVSLGVIAGLLAISVVASIIKARRTGGDIALEQDVRATTTDQPSTDT